MNMREPENKIKFGPRRSSGPTLVVTTILTVIAALALVIGVRAVETANLGATSLIQVPEDYSTIQAAIDAASPGDIIQVEAGVYHENLKLDKPVSLTAKSFDEINPINNQTIIDGGPGAVTILIPAGLTQMPSIRGFVIRNGSDGIQAASEFIAEYNYFYSARNLISYQMGAGGVNRNNVYFSAGGNAIRMDNMNRALLIENNRILYSGADGIEISLQRATAPPATAVIDIRNNMILGNGRDGIQFIQHPGNPQDTNRRFYIAGNLIANNRKAGLGLMPNANAIEDYSGAEVEEALRVFNNTFYGNDYGISGGGNLVAFNNIFANSVTGGVWKVQGRPGSNAIVAFSLFHNNRFDSGQANLGAGNLMSVDPLFEAAPNPGPDGAWKTVDDDFSGLVLRSDSPAVDKGIAQFTTNTGELVPPTPIAGFTGAAPDLGWRELGAPIFPTSTPTPLSSPTPLPTGTVETPSPQPTSTSVPGSPTPTNTVTLTPESPTLSPPPASPTITPSPIVTPTSTPQLIIQNINPNIAQANTTITMTITGSGFQNGVVVTFEGGQGPPQEVLATQVVDTNTIVVTMTARNEGSFGTQVWDVRVTNPDGSTTVLADAFTVTPVP